jgi:hypothetical protein
MLLRGRRPSGVSVSVIQERVAGGGEPMQAQAVPVAEAIKPARDPEPVTWGPGLFGRALDGLEGFYDRVLFRG